MMSQVKYCVGQNAACPEDTADKDKEGYPMKMEAQLQILESENEQLRKDRDEMLKIITQMRITMNRLIDQYIVIQKK